MRIQLVLGGANLGLAYGTAISRLLPGEAHVERLLSRAAQIGYSRVDTARSYGLSEVRVGAHLRRGRGFRPDDIGTKLSPLVSLDERTPPSRATELARESLKGSLRALRVERIGRVLVHRCEHLQIAGGVVWDQLKRVQDEGRIGELGVSVQSPSELMRAMAEPRAQWVQLPCNILDWRFDNVGLQEQLCARRADLRIEVRSLFLQGVLAAGSPRVFPSFEESYDARGVVDWLQARADALTEGALDALCFRYAASLPWADALVVGADTIEQLERLSSLAHSAGFSPSVVEELRADRPWVPGALLDPSQWRSSPES